MIKFEKDVSDFMDECSSTVGRYEDDMFNVDEFNFCDDHNISSPIEQILHCAFMALLRINCIPKCDYREVGGRDYNIGIDMEPQFHIGNYRVDFLAFNKAWPDKNGDQEVKEVVVECDSQIFHERTERERRYEKARDRFLQSKGYKIFHFTGKEIKDNPFKVAAEIISYLNGRDIYEIIDENFISEKYLVRKGGK